MILIYSWREEITGVGKKDKYYVPRPHTESLICLKRGAYDDGSMDSIHLEINGESREIPPVSNVRALLEILGVAEGRVAVEVNRKIIHRGDWDSTPISDRDRVEIVQFVGGG